MPSRVKPVLEETIEALSVFDADRLEELCTEAEALLANRSEASVRSAVDARALQRTLMELLRTTDANLRVLRELRELRVRGLRSSDNEALTGAPRWVR
jgi:hypothetical protein